MQYAVTSLPFEQARLADLIRGHWTIEVLHHLRDLRRPLTTLGISLG